MDCPKCGATDLTTSVKFCEYCGTSLDNNVRFSPPSAPAAVNQNSTIQQVQTNQTLAQIDSSAIPQGYLEIFREIEANQGKITPKWNWWAFIFSALWYFYKGIWAKGLIILCLGLFSAGIAIPLTWIYCGIFGNYDYYLVKIKNTQLW